MRKISWPKLANEVYAFLLIVVGLVYYHFQHGHVEHVAFFLWPPLLAMAVVYWSVMHYFLKRPVSLLLLGYRVLQGSLLFVGVIGAMLLLKKQYNISEVNALLYLCVFPLVNSLYSRFSVRYSTFFEGTNEK